MWDLQIFVKIELSIIRVNFANVMYLEFRFNIDSER